MGEITLFNPPTNPIFSLITNRFHAYSSACYDLWIRSLIPVSETDCYHDISEHQFINWFILVSYPVCYNFSQTL